MDFIVHGLRNNPELAIFLTLAIGFLIGRLKFGSFSLGIVVGTLLAGVVIGQLDIKVSPLVKTVFFDLFLFTTGYKVGPQFFRGLKSDAIPQVALTVVICVTCLVSAFVAAKIFGYDIGTAAVALGSVLNHGWYGCEAIKGLTIADAEKIALLNNIRRLCQVYLTHRQSRRFTPYRSKPRGSPCARGFADARSSVAAGARNDVAKQHLDVRTHVTNRRWRTRPPHSRGAAQKVPGLDPAHPPWRRYLRITREWSSIDDVIAILTRKAQPAAPRRRSG